MDSPYFRLETALETARDLLVQIPDHSPSNTPRTKNNITNIGDILLALVLDAKQKNISIPTRQHSISPSQTPSRSPSRSRDPSVNLPDELEQPVSDFVSRNRTCLEITQWATQQEPAAPKPRLVSNTSLLFDILFIVYRASTRKSTRW